LVCFLPISWCTNILSNSNFILRMIEWQSESSMFTLRVRGKQWYWVYKLELKSLVSSVDSTKNIGSNNYIRTTTLSNNDLFFVKFKHDIMYNYLTWSGNISSESGVKAHTQNFTNTHVNSLPKLVIEDLINIPELSNNKLMAFNSFYTSNNSFFVHGANLNLKTSNLSPISEGNSLLKVSSGTSNLVDRVQKLNTSYSPMRLLISRSNQLTLHHHQNNFIKKPFNNNLFLVIKQKRFSSPNFNSNSSKFTKTSLSYYKRDLKNLNSYFNEHFNITSLKSSINNKRLLRTRRVLVLPTKTNITLITNSFDVMHSWYIPGLGVKLDCVPGRSTHHVVHIDHTGFYYGQCAEICGRYHHHMPIRVCALPFNHFILWW